MASSEILYSSMFQPLIKKISEEIIFINFNKTFNNLILLHSQFCPFVDNVNKFV